MRVYLGLGTNLGDKESNLHVAVRKINERIGEVTALSAFYVTAPWGFSSVKFFSECRLLRGECASSLGYIAGNTGDRA